MQHIRFSSLLLKDRPPWPTVHRWFARLREDGACRRTNHRLVMFNRETVAPEAGPTAAVIDSQSVRTTKSGQFHGYIMRAKR